MITQALSRKDWRYKREVFIAIVILCLINTVFSVGMMFYFQRLLILTSSWTIRAQKQYSALRWINFPRGSWLIASVVKMHQFKETIFQSD